MIICQLGLSEGRGAVIKNIPRTMESVKLFGWGDRKNMSSHGGNSCKMTMIL